MGTFSRVLDHLEEWLVASFMALATAVIFISVLYRYTADVAWIWNYTRHINLTWAQELCIYLFIWMAKFGAAYGVRTGIHVGVDVLVRLLSPPKRRFWITFDLVAGAFFTGVIAVLGGMFVGRMFGTGQVSPDLELPMWLVYLAVPLGSSLMCYRFLQVAWRFHRTGELPVHSHARVEGLDAQART
jgi:C4-dicarboxylate transporter DctQ subunit